MAALHALLLTDVVDSTRLTEQLDEEAATALWSAHDRLARDLIPRWRGREIDKTDGMLVLFDAVPDALGYALAYHDALRERGLGITARAGIHFGPVSLRANPADDVSRGAKPIEVDGIALPMVARVMSIAGGGQTLLARRLTPRGRRSNRRNRDPGGACLLSPPVAKARVKVAVRAPELRMTACTAPAGRVLAADRSSHGSMVASARANVAVRIDVRTGFSLKTRS